MSGGISEHLALPVDVSVGRSVHSLISEIRHNFNTVPSIICTSAGITRDAFLLKMDEKSWDAVIDVNLKVLDTRIFCHQCDNLGNIPGYIPRVTSCLSCYGRC